MARPHTIPYLQIRVKFGSSVAFGPGKADLLEQISATGSISAAARNMRMSYKRAWQLVDEMNRLFRKPLVGAIAGGSQGGGAALTTSGLRVLNSYRNLQQHAAVAVKKELASLGRLATRRRGEA